MNFEQLLEGANDPNPFKATMIWGLAQQRMSPAVMREVWAALKEARDYILEHGNDKDMAPAVEKLERAQSLLNGEKPENKEN